MNSTTATTNRFRFRLPLIALTLLSLWRLVISFWEYDNGPFVSVVRSLLDQAPFWAFLSFLTAAYLGWGTVSQRANQFLLLGICAMILSATDLVLFNGAARENLYTGTWTGDAHVTFVKDPPWEEKNPALSVTFTPDHQALFVMGASSYPIHRGSWEMDFDPMRCHPRLSFSGFGRGEYWNQENLYVRGAFKIGDRSYQISAQLKQVRKRPV